MKSITKRLFPWLVPIARNIRGHLSVAEVTERVIYACKARVVAGPFRGMRYIAKANGSALMPKLLGTYERELHSIIERVVRCSYDTVINVGCAEGYYAVGLALRMPLTKVEAYDIDSQARDNLRALAGINGVLPRITIRAKCGNEALLAHAGKRCLMICDIEGAEQTFLDPLRFPALVDFDILVEVHDGVAANAIHRLLVERYSGTHELEFVRYSGRSYLDVRHLHGVWHPKNRLMAVDEGRVYGTEWGFFSARRWQQQGSV